MSQPPNFSFYNGSVQYSSTVQFPQFGVQPFPTQQHNPYTVPQHNPNPNQYHYNTHVHQPTWSTYPVDPPSAVQTSPHLQPRPQSPQLYGNTNNSYTSPRRQSSPLMFVSQSVPVPSEKIPKTQPSPLVSTSSTVSNITQTPQKDLTTTTNKVYKSPNRSQIFLERAKKLGIVCSRSKSPDKSQEQSLNGEDEAVEKKNELNSLFYQDTVVIDKESAEDMDTLFSSVARKLSTEVICSAVIELNAEYGISIEVDDFLKCVDDLLDDIDNKNSVLDEAVFEKLESEKLESNLEKLSSVTSSQTSLLNPDTPEFKPLNIDIMDSMYLPFQTIPISPEYPEQNANNNNIHTESFMMSTRNQDFVEIRSRWEEMVEVETQTVVEMVEKATITEFLYSLINIETQTVHVETKNSGVQTDVPLVTAVPPKVKSKNKKLQTDPEMFPVKSSDPNYRYMKMLEKEVYNLRSQMCLIEIQRELHELQSTKSRWTEFFTPRHAECNGLNEMLDARVKWLQQCHINIQTQLESGIARLDTGVGLKQLPEPIIFIPTASGNQTFVPKSVLSLRQGVQIQQTNNQEFSLPEKEQAVQKDNVVSQMLVESKISDDKHLMDETSTSSSSGEFNPGKDSSVKPVKDVMESEGSSEGDASKEMIQPSKDTHDPSELNNTGLEESAKKPIESDSKVPENISTIVNFEKCSFKDLIEAQSVHQTSEITSRVETKAGNDHISDVNTMNSNCEQNKENLTMSLNVNPSDDQKISEKHSVSQPRISSTSISTEISTSEPSEINPCTASIVNPEQSPLGHNKVSKVVMSPSANLDVIDELTGNSKEVTTEESTLLRNQISAGDTGDGFEHEYLKSQDPKESTTDTYDVHNTKSIDQPELTVKVEDIPLPESNADEQLIRKDKYVAEQETLVKENNSRLFSETTTNGLEEKIDLYLSDPNFDCPEKHTLSDVMNPEQTVSDNSLFSPTMNTPLDTPLKQEVPQVLNKDLLKAVTTQLVHDYPSLLSNPDYLKNLADHQTLLLQSYLDQKTNPSGAQAKVPDTSAHNIGSLPSINAQTNQQSSLNPTGATNSQFANVSSPGSSRSNSPVQFLQPSNIDQAMNTFPLRPANPLTSSNFISQQNMVRRSPNGSHLQQVSMSNATLQHQYNVNSFQNQYDNRPIFVNVPVLPVKTQNASGLYPMRQQNPIEPRVALSTTHTGPQFKNPVAPHLIQMPMKCASNIQSNSKIMHQERSDLTVIGSDGQKGLDLPETQPIKEPSPPLSIKSYLVQKDKVNSTKRKNLFSPDGTAETDSHSMDTSSETLYNTSFSKPDIADTQDHQQSPNEKGKSRVNTLNVFQGSSSFMDHSGYMSDCNIDTQVKRKSSLGYLQTHNTGYMSDSGFKSNPKTSSVPGFQCGKMDPTVTTAALLSGANAFKTGSIKAHGIPNLLSDNVQRFPNPKDSTTNINKHKPIKTIVQQPEVLHTRKERKTIDTDLKNRKRNKTTSEVSKASENKPLPMFQTNTSQDDWDLEADPYPTTFKFKTDAQKALNFGKNASDLCTFSNLVVQPNSSGDSKTKKAGFKSEAKVNTQFLGRLLKSTESSNERKNLKAIPQALAMTSSIEDSDGEMVDEWQTVPKKLKKVKPEVILPPPKPAGKKKRTVKEDAAFTKLIELMTARIPNTNSSTACLAIPIVKELYKELQRLFPDIFQKQLVIAFKRNKNLNDILVHGRLKAITTDDAIYIIGEIRKKKGTLKGIPLKDIIEMGTTIMSSKENKLKIATGSRVTVETHFAKDIPPRFKRIMEHSVTELSLPKSYEEGDVCVICCDELSAERTKALDCGHEFHIMCINEWVYKHERTCPTCRQIALFPEEFPTLGNNENRFMLL